MAEIREGLEGNFQTALNAKLAILTREKIIVLGNPTLTSILLLEVF